MDIRLRDRVEMKKPHPCGEKIMLPRAKAEKGIKKILEREEKADE